MTVSMATPGPVRRPDAVLWGVVALATAARVWLAWRFFGFLGGDDVEIVQEAFRVATGLDYTPWNVRNLLLPDALVAPVVRLGVLIGVRDPGHLAFVAALPFILLASVNIVLVYRVALAWLGDVAAARAAAVLYASHWLALAYGSTVYPRTVTTTCVLLAALALSGPGRDGARGLSAGAALALAFAGRYSEGMYLLPLLLLSALAPSGRAAALRRTLGVMGGFAAGAALAVGLYDLLTWGSPFSSFVALFRFALVQRASSAAVAVQPPLIYLQRALFWVTPALVPALGFAWGDRRVRWAWPFVVIPVAVLSLIAHKELRYLQGAIPFLALLAGAGFVALARRWGKVPAAALMVLAVGADAYGATVLTGKSVAAVVAARRMAAEPSVHVVALEQSWAYGGRLFLGNGVEVRDLPVPPNAAAVAAAADGADRVGLYLKDVESDPALRIALAEHGFGERARYAWGASKVVVVFARHAQR